MAHLTYHVAIETATDWGSVAVGVPGRALAHVSLEPRSHAATALPAIEQLLATSGITLGGVGGIVVGDGPGSFTGVRIGFATAKGLLEGRTGVSLHVIPSLMAAAWNHRHACNAPVVALYDALRGEVFAAAYRFDDGAVHTLSPPRLATVDALRATLQPPPGIAVGDGAMAFAREIRSWTGRDPVAPPAGIATASALLELLPVSGAAREVADIAGLEPAYGRAPAAQDEWERQHGRPLPGAPGDAR